MSKRGRAQIEYLERKYIVLFSMYEFKSFNVNFHFLCAYIFVLCIFFLKTKVKSKASKQGVDANRCENDDYNLMWY